MITSYDLMIALEDTLQDNLIGTGKFTKTVRIMRDEEIESMLTPVALPAVLISCISENDVIGHFQNSKVVVTTVKIRIITHSTDPNKYRTGEITDNIYSLTEDIKEAVYSNKRLYNNSFCLRSRFEVRDEDMFFDGKMNGCISRSIFLDYEKDESWDGMKNDQTTTDFPASISF
jgi:hypothetical protein